MRTLNFTLLLLVLFLIACTNGIKAQSTHTQLNKVIIGSIDSIHSRILNEQRKIWVYVPNSGSQDSNSTQHYPVVYLLDGDSHFSSVVGMIQQLSSVNGNTICPEMIVVGIPNTDRTRDLTPTHSNSYKPWMDSSACISSGGGENFITFIEKELMSHIDSVYPTAPYRILIGHSFGGLTAVNTLIHHTNLFNAYVAIDPSMFWDNQKLLKEAKIKLANTNYTGVSFFLGIANTMFEGMDTIQVKNDTSMWTTHIRSILELNDYQYSNKQNHLKYTSKYYNHDDHASVPLIVEYDALRFIFDYYNLKKNLADLYNINKALIDKLENHYQNVSKQIGYEVRPPQDIVNILGYWAVYLKRFEEAVYLFKLNVANYPARSDVYDSLGDGYSAKGDKPNAIDSYQKALSIKEAPDTRKKLEKLQEE